MYVHPFCFITYYGIVFTFYNVEQLSVGHLMSVFSVFG